MQGVAEKEIKMGKLPSETEQRCLCPLQGRLVTCLWPACLTKPLMRWDMALARQLSIIDCFFHPKILLDFSSSVQC